MNEGVKRLLGLFKNQKLIIGLGLAGILLIFLSSLFPKSDKKSESVSAENSTDSYISATKSDIEVLVKKISGVNRVSVVLTLETGVTYNYAEEFKDNATDKSSSSGSDSTQNREQKKTVVTDAEGNEAPIVINEFLPVIRGVAVVYGAPDNEFINNKISSALTAALDISSKQIFIYGNGG